MLEIKERFCKRCSHLCHCIEADHEGCKCIGCNCPKANVWNYEEDVVADKYEKDRENDLSFENNGIVIDDSNDCESCQ